MTVDKNRGLLKELIVGILMYGGIIQILLLFISRTIVYHSLGLWIGAATGCGMIIHMKRALEDALDLGENGATKYIRKTYGIRMVVVAIVFGVTFYFQIGSILTTFIGVMGLKISAYAQPYMHKILMRFEKK